MKIITIIGARPQFIKASVVSKKFKKEKHIEEIVIHTGQHHDNNMSEIFFEQMKIDKPKYFLNINSLDHGAMTGRMIEEIEKILILEQPDLVLVYGDTNSTLAGALAANKLNIKIAHIESGLRSNNNVMPEETNRIIVDRISDILFVPSSKAINNLEQEGFEHFPKEIIYCGDVMYDTMKLYQAKMTKPNMVLPKQFILCTLHREENINNPQRFDQLIKLIQELSEKCTIVLPAHPRLSGKIPKLDNVILIKPVGYLEILWLLDHCYCVVTDSGGLQKEAYFNKKICLTIRNETEWIELVDLKANFLVNTDKIKAIETFQNIKNVSANFNSNIYGNGDASDIIVKTICKIFK